MKNSPARKVCGRNAVAAIGRAARVDPVAVVARAGMGPAVVVVVALAAATVVRVPVVPVAVPGVVVRALVAVAVAMIAVAVIVRNPNAARHQCWLRCPC